MMTDARKALVLFSGEQDSTTCLAWALSRYTQVETIGFDYGQRHHIEMDMRPRILRKIRDLATDWPCKPGDDHIIDLNALGTISHTALTSHTAIRIEENGLPNTFVPGRNLMFLTFAGAVAYRRGLGSIIGGMCETDFSGYPDCRHATIKSMSDTLALGMDEPFTIETPLMWLDKSETWSLAHRLGGPPLLDLILEDTHTCYLGERGHRHDWGYGCAQCPACELRAHGWHKFKNRA